MALLAHNKVINYAPSAPDAAKADLPGLVVRLFRSEDDLTSLFQPGTAPQTREVFMNWFILIVAGLFEIGWAVGLKYTEGFARPWPTAGTVLAMAISLGLLGIAMTSLPVGTAYAIWVGVGAVHPSFATWDWHRGAA